MITSSAAVYIEYQVARYLWNLGVMLLHENKNDKKIPWTQKI